MTRQNANTPVKKIPMEPSYLGEREGGTKSPMICRFTGVTLRGRGIGEKKHLKSRKVDKGAPDKLAGRIRKFLGKTPSDSKCSPSLRP